MKNIIKVLILTSIISQPLVTFGDEVVLKSFTPPISNVKPTNTKIKPQNDVNKRQQKSNQASDSIVSISNSCPIAQPLIPQNATKPPSEYIYKDDSTTISNIDPTSANSTNSYYPGLRGSNQLIIYTPSYGVRTGTNEFGSEAIVIDNTVIQLNGADSLIPPSGFVISGHGNAKKWINENISIGSKILIDNQNNKLHSYLTSDSLIFAAKEKIKEANSLMEYYRSIDVLYDDKASLGYIAKAKEELRKAERDEANAQLYISQASEAANLAIKHAIPYRAEELKGIWIRPTEKTPEDIVKTLDKLQNVGINNIFLETYFHGKTIYPSQVLNNYGVINQNESFIGFDPLKVWIDEAHKRNIKVNIWFETFYVGNQPPCSSPKNVLNVYPNWANTTKAGYASSTPVASISEHNGYFIDPANPDVQNYLLSIINEIVVNYCPDGINLDYIRYPQSIAAKFGNYDMTNWGYTNYARDEFKRRFCVDPIDIKYNTDAWNIWAKYRQDKVSNFVCQVKQVTTKYGITLTTVVFPDRQKSLETKMQDWKTWSLNNYVDGFTPLILTSDKTTASSMIKDIRVNAGSNIKIYPGLFVTFMGGAFDDLLMQIQESRKLGTDGVVLFDYAHLDQKYIDALKARVYNPSKPLVLEEPKSFKTPLKKKKRWFKRHRD